VDARLRVCATIERVRSVRVTISGRVQGVFFRASCADLARDLGLSGAVRNLRDGRLEATFQGPDDAVDRMLAWCREGPPMARVDDLEVEVVSPFDEGGFRVER
jgi:acylphosphatase